MKFVPNKSIQSIEQTKGESLTVSPQRLVSVSSKLPIRQNSVFVIDAVPVTSIGGFFTDDVGWRDWWENLWSRTIPDTVFAQAWSITRLVIWRSFFTIDRFERIQVFQRMIEKLVCQKKVFKKWKRRWPYLSLVSTIFGHPNSSNLRQTIRGCWLWGTILTTLVWIGGSRRDLEWLVVSTFPVRTWKEDFLNSSQKFMW